MADDAGGEIIIEDAVLAGGFVQVPAAVYFDARLKDGAVRVYGALLWYAWKYGRFPGQEGMAADLGATSRTVRRHLSELEKAGYIEARVLGLGRPNQYIVKSLGKATVPDRTKLSGQRGQNRPVKVDKTGRSPRVVDSDVKEDRSLSHTPAPENGALVGAFFEAIGVSKPAAKARERAGVIIADLTAEGFTAEALQEAFRLAAERGARGPDLLPYLVGEAQEAVDRRATTQAQVSAIQEQADRQTQQFEERHREDLARVDRLTPDERARLQAQARIALGLSPDREMSPAVQAAVTGWIAARLRGDE